MILRALAKLPDERYANAEEMRRALDATPEGRRAAGGGKHRALIWGAAAAIVLLSIGIVALLLRR